MASPLALTLLLLIAGQAAAGRTLMDAPATRTARIINGTPVAGAGAGLDFVAQLQLDGEWVCGGTLIAADTVLTAAHCTIPSEDRENDDGSIVFKAGFLFPAELMTVALQGHWNGSSFTRSFRVASIHPHRDYNERVNPRDSKPWHDVAVIKLATPVDDITPVRLPTANTRLNLREELQVAGWGATSEFDYGSETLLQATVLSLPSKSCPQPRASDCICAGGSSNTCYGDSGGPLLAHDAMGEPILVGITSYGPDCPAPKGQMERGFYTDVRQYLADIAMCAGEFDAGSQQHGGAMCTPAGAARTLAAAAAPAPAPAGLPTK